MRILVLSNVLNGFDAIVEALNSRHSIIAKQVSVGTEDLANMAVNGLASGNYDLCIVVARDPVGASITLNKSEGISAAVCNSASDVELAKRNNANILVIKGLKPDAAAEIAEAISQQGFSFNALRQIKLPRIGIGIGKESAAGQRPPQQPQLQAQQQKRQQQVRQKQNEESEEGEENEEEEEQARQAGGKGIIGKIKNALGII